MLYLATAPRLKLDKIKMNCGDQRINTTLLTGVVLQMRQTGHRQMKPSGQCRKKIPHRTSIHYDHHQHIAADSYLAS